MEINLWARFQSKISLLADRFKIVLRLAGNLIGKTRAIRGTKAKVALTSRRMSWSRFFFAGVPRTTVTSSPRCDDLSVCGR